MIYGIYGINNVFMNIKDYKSCYVMYVKRFCCLFYVFSCFVNLNIFY